MTATMSATWTGRLRQRELGTASAGAAIGPLATATWTLGHRLEHRDPVDDADDPPVLDGAHGAVRGGDHGHRVAHRRGDGQLRARLLLARRAARA